MCLVVLLSSMYFVLLQFVFVIYSAFISMVVSFALICFILLLRYFVLICFLLCSLCPLPSYVVLLSSFIFICFSLCCFTFVFFCLDFVSFTSFTSIVFSFHCFPLSLPFPLSFALPFAFAFCFSQRRFLFFFLFAVKSCDGFLGVEFKFWSFVEEKNELKRLNS